MTASPTFDRKTALVFGGAKGIGECVVREWARRGSRVAIADIDGVAAQAIAAGIRADGGEAIGLRADVLSSDSIAAAIAASGAEFGPVEILMNNVGGMLNGHPEDVPLREWQRMMELNYFAAVRAIEQVLPGMLTAGRGHIVCTASFAGLYPYAASRVPYAAAKAAVISLAQNLAVYGEPKGVRVSCLIPGPVMTGVLDTMTSWTPDCPMRGPGSDTTLMLPEDVARVLADGMEAGRILIPSDDAAFEIVRRWAANPDAFIRAKIGEFAGGDSGRPSVPDALRAPLGR